MPDYAAFAHKTIGKVSDSLVLVCSIHKSLLLNEALKHLPPQFVSPDVNFSVRAICKAHFESRKLSFAVNDFLLWAVCRDEMSLEKKVGVLPAVFLILNYQLLSPSEQAERNVKIFLVHQHNIANLNEDVILASCIFTDCKLIILFFFFHFGFF